MNEEKNLLTADAADRLLACADGTAALLYLHILRSGKFSLTAASKVLKRSEAEVALAADTLRRLGLLEAQPLQPAQESPHYTAQDIVACADRDSAFAGVISEAERALGRVLNTNDLILLYSIYDFIGLPADVIMVLLHHCIEAHQARNGAGRMPTMRSIEREAWYWSQQEITDLDSAEEHIRREKAKREKSTQVKAVLQIRDRAFTATEKKYVEGWLSMGYDAETLAIAYDRTVTATGRLQWKYMDSIVRSWNEKRLYTPEDIARGDTRPGKQTPAARQAAQSRSDQQKVADMRDILKNMTGGEG